jgi:TRAP-type transport system periplasmic protein
MRSRLLTAIAVTALFAITCFPSGAPAADKKVTLRVGDPVAATDVINVSLIAWGKEVAKATNGSVEVKVFPNSQLGGELEMVQQVSAGSLEMVVTGNTGYDPLPYAFLSAKHLQKVLDTGVMEPFFEQFRAKQGLRFVGYLERSPRNLTANRAIKAPADIKGLKLRAPQAEVIVNAWQAVGANVTPLAFPELFQALQAGTVEGQENPVELIYNSKFYEVQKFMMRTEHGFPPFYIFMSDKVWTGMTDAQRKAVDATLKEAIVQHRERLGKAVGDLTAKLKERGMQVVEVDKKAFRDVMWPKASRPYIVKTWGEDAVKKLEALAE